MKQMNEKTRHLIAFFKICKPAKNVKKMDINGIKKSLYSDDNRDQIILIQRYRSQRDVSFLKKYLKN